MLSLKPRKLFLLDGVGALITFISLLVLRQWNEYFGMPSDTLAYLALVAAGFSIYSLSCFVKFSSQWPLFLKGIATANALYCLATLILLILHYDKLTALGIAYFIGEILIIIGLVSLEFKTATASLPAAR